ncbi:MAG: hypothetical protein WCO23_05225, partial [bacterium]
MVKNISAREIENLLNLRGKLTLASINEKLSTSGISIEGTDSITDAFQDYVNQKIARRLKHNHRKLPLYSKKDITDFVPELVRHQEEILKVEFDRPTRKACGEFLTVFCEHFANIDASGRMNKDPYEEVWAWIKVVLDLCDEQKTTPEVLLGVKSNSDEITRRLYTKEGYISRSQRSIQAGFEITNLINATFEMAMAMMANQIRKEEATKYELLFGTIF